MSLVLEIGNGVRNANTYIDADFVTAYLTARGRESENGWSGFSDTEKDAAVLKAADYIEKRFSGMFIGTKEFTYLTGLSAVGRIEYVDQPDPGDTIEIGAQTYTFVDTLSTDGDYEVLIGDDADGTYENLTNAITAGGDAGTDYSDNVLYNRSVYAEQDTDTTTVSLAVREVGDAGNYTRLVSTLNNATVTGFELGADDGPQPMSWPRSGTIITGIPRQLREAQAEYAVRAISAALLSDPSGDADSGAITRLKQKVGSLEVDTTYADNGSTRATGVSLISDSNLPEYPPADLLLQSLIGSAGFGRFGRA